MRTLYAALVLNALLASPVLADDATAKLGAGGLQFTPAPDIRMASEDLYLSPAAVRIRYEFANDGKKDITAVVAFPLPDIDSYQFYGEAIGATQKDPVNFVGFTATVDGKPVPVAVEQRAFIGNRDVTAQVKGFGLPIDVVLAPGGVDLIKKLPKRARDAMTKAGLVEPQEDGDADPDYAARWTVRTKFYWTQTFPAGKAIVIAHSYKPVTGATFYTDDDLHPRAVDAGEFSWTKNYCIDAGTRAQLARQLAAQKKANKQDGMLSIWSTDFILKTANEWKGGIGRFHLTLDKLKPGNTLSLCGYDDIRKTGPATFEVTRNNFAPTSDISFVVISNDGVGF